MLDHSTASAYLAEIIQPHGRHEIVDRESRNGTRVNGALVRSQVLKDGDLITLGASSLHYLSDSTADAESTALGYSPEVEPDGPRHAALAGQQLVGAYRIRPAPAGARLGTCAVRSRTDVLTRACGRRAYAIRPYGRKSVAISLRPLAHQRQGRAVDAAAVLAHFAVVEHDCLDASLVEPFDGVRAIV